MSNFNLAPFLAHVTKLQLTKFSLTDAHVEAISKLNKVTDLLLTEMVKNYLILISLLTSFIVYQRHRRCCKNSLVVDRKFEETAVTKYKKV